MRRLLTIACEGETLGATLDEVAGTTGVLIVTGGGQTRIGSHRLFERLATRLAQAGYPVLRFDRRGVGDSSGEDPGFRGSCSDISAAALALRSQLPRLERVVGLGLCDGASALCLAEVAEIDALILVNPWLVEAEAGSPPPAAIRAHYRERLMSREAWKQIATGAVSYSKLFKGIAKITRPEKPSSLALDVAAGLRRRRRPATVLLARGDGTAIAARKEIQARAFAGLIDGIEEIDSDSHTFAKPGDVDALLAAVIRTLQR